MINVTRSELIQLAMLYLVANTPRSLLEGLARRDAVNKFRYDVPIEDLLTYYEKITSRAKRSEIVVGLAYAVLVGILLHKDNLGGQISPEASRLQWGEQLKMIANSINTPTKILELASPSARINANSTPGSSLIVPAGGPTQRWEGTR